MQHLQLGWLDYAVLVVYLTMVVAVGWGARRRMKASADFFLAGRSIPAWIAGLAFL